MGQFLSCMARCAKCMHACALTVLNTHQHLHKWLQAKEEEQQARYEAGEQERQREWVRAYARGACDVVVLHVLHLTWCASPF